MLIFSAEKKQIVDDKKINKRGILRFRYHLPL
jgi:hypothetical protein